MSEVGTLLPHHLYKPHRLVDSINNNNNICMIQIVQNMDVTILQIIHVRRKKILWIN